MLQQGMSIIARKKCVAILASYFSFLTSQVSNFGASKWSVQTLSVKDCVHCTEKIKKKCLTFSLWFPLNFFLHPDILSHFSNCQNSWSPHNLCYFRFNFIQFSNRAKIFGFLCLNSRFSLPI